MTSGKQINHELQPKDSRTTLGSWRRLGVLCLLLAVKPVAASSQTFTSLLSFDGANGDEPVFALLVQGGDGNLYGTTYYGGEYDSGTVFKMTPTGTLTVLYSFYGGADGLGPEAGLVLGTDGNFYGTTYRGGGDSNYCFEGCGTVFKITSGGTLTTLHRFGSTDGANPYGDLVQAFDGSFYGTTECEDGNCGTNVYGTVFKITPTGTLTTLHNFDSTDGAYPFAGLIQASNGNFYGTTAYGGASNACSSGCGTIFEMTAGGTLTTLHSFDGTDGSNPYAPLVQAATGDFYGTTAEGGSKGWGTVFRITPGGTLTTLHNLGTAGPGYYPFAGLFQATDGNFYGTTTYGGSGGCTDGCGTVFQITPEGALTTLHNFDSADGDYPFGGLFQATNGTLYGATTYGGSSTACSDCGTVFSVSMGLGPFVETVPSLGPVGAPVKILGTNLTGATSVTFNGTAATFTINATGTAINAAVPSGATTGTVQVVTPGGTLSSNVPFRVRH